MILQVNPRILITKCLAYPGTRVGIRLGILFCAVIVLHQNFIAHTYWNSHIRFHPYLYFHAATPPEDGRDDTQGYEHIGEDWIGLEK